MTQNPYNVSPLFRLDGQTAVVTGGGGILCGAMCRTLAAAGARVVVLGRTLPKLQQVVDDIRAAGGEAIACQADVLVKDQLQAACDQVLQTYGQVDILINGAGGNHPSATTSAALPFFNLQSADVEAVFRNNFTGAFLASQVFGKQMANQNSGVILNIASMASLRPLTRVLAYSAAKAALVNFTQWLAVHLAQEYCPLIRVNALAPGFFITEQNRALLTNPDTGEFTPRGKSIVTHTPMQRMGQSADLLGATLWLVSPASAFVTGIVLPVDGGFSAFSGV